MDFSSFEERCLKARKGNEKSIYEIISQYYPDVDEIEFTDQVIKNLQRGRFLLLIIGDGIRENVQEIANFMNHTTNMNFTLSLIEMPIYEIDEKTKIVIPKIMMKTKQIEREVIIVKDSKIKIVDSSKITTLSKSASESEFYERLKNNIGTNMALEVEKILNKFVSDHDMMITLGRGKRISINLKDPNGRYNFASIQETGEVWFYGIVEKMKDDGYQSIAENYLTKLSVILDAEYDKKMKIWYWGIKRKGKYLNVSEYINKKDEWEELLIECLLKVSDKED